jgi:signal transduction histidine kinase/DNA-binding response OmpR family regulator
VFALYRLHRLQYIIGGIALSVLVVAVGMLMASHRRRLARYQGALTVTLENMRQGIIMVDRDQHVAVINRRVGELLGLPAALLHEGMDFGTIVRWQVEHGEFAPDLPTGVEIDAVHDRYGLGNKVSVYERVRPNGTVLEVRTALLPNGGAVRTYTDITERKHNEHDLAAARDAAEAAGQARAQFLTVMSHEIRTPLNGIIGAAALLLDRRLDPEDQHYVEIIRHSGDHLLQLVNDILDFSRLDASCMELEEVEFDLRATFTGSVEMCATSAQAKGLALTLRVAEDVPARAIGDPGRLRQVLLNLVGNAVKFTEQGSIDMAVSCAACETDVVRIEVAVRDTGIGIPAEALPRLFHEFSQVDGSISRRFGGSGLGLVISRRLVERMGGLLSVESTPGQGSTFHFGVALRPAPILFVEEQAVWRTRQPARRLHILLVEDNATNRLIASRMLERMGHRVDAVADGSEAVETVQTMPYDLVLMDVMMPEMDGLTATRLIRDLPGHTSRTPIVGLTANAERSREAACREAGMDGFVSKPVTAERLAEAIDDVTTTCRGEAKADCCPQLDEAVLSRLADDIGFANALDVVQLFLDEAPRMMNRLEQAIRVEDRALLREVHTLASAARSVGLLRVGQTAADVESLLSAGRPTAPLLAALPDILAEDVSLLADWMSHQHATA